MIINGTSMVKFGMISPTWRLRDFIFGFWEDYPGTIRGPWNSIAKVVDHAESPWVSPIDPLFSVQSPCRHDPKNQE